MCVSESEKRVFVRLAQNGATMRTFPVTAGETVISTARAFAEKIQ